MKKWVEEWARPPLRYLLSWLWVKQFLYWAIISAGTISECAFLIASIWMSINSSVHPFVLTMMSEKQSIQLSYIATTIYTALPELILSLALVTAINHCRNIRRGKTYWYTWVWAILFGLPTIVFLFISIMTVACSVLKVNYIMPDWGIVSRALAGFSFAIVYLLYERIGKPCFASERKALEQTIADLRVEIEQTTSRFENALQTTNTNFKTAMQSKQSEFEYRFNTVVKQSKDRIENLTLLLETQTQQANRLAEHASSLELRGIEDYPKVMIEWLEKGVKTVSIGEIESVTGHSRQRINGAIKSGRLQKDNRNKDRIRVSSVIEWLKIVPLPDTLIPDQSNGKTTNHSNHSIEAMTFDDLVELEVD
jgi:hypothetical protein